MQKVSGDKFFTASQVREVEKAWIESTALWRETRDRYGFAWKNSGQINKAGFFLVLRRIKTTHHKIHLQSHSARPAG